jgi:hypothetical protein
VKPVRLGQPKAILSYTDQDLGRATLWIGFASLGLFTIGCAGMVWDLISYTTF